MYEASSQQDASCLAFLPLTPGCEMILSRSMTLGIASRLCKLAQKSTSVFFFAVLILWVEAASSSVLAEYASEQLYVDTIKPLLKQRCYACHGALKQEAGLRLDTVQFIKSGGDSGPAIHPGDGAGSLLVHRASATDTTRMPPEHEGERMEAEQLDLLRRWINEGAPAPAQETPEPDPAQHWAFQPLGPAAIASPSLAAHPIDHFLAASQQTRGIVAAPIASPPMQLRRLWLDLVGVPPPEELVKQWSEEDIDEPRYLSMVEQLLADPRHGQRWARHWMDIWRYSDWWGLGDQLRNSQKHLWHWRDWLVESLNQNTPYDEMIRQMLAADELYPGDLKKLRATGFLARNYFLFNRHQWMDETVEHVSKGIMGVTMNCAKCHDHKYDPFSQEDYYRMRAIFEPYVVRNEMIPGILNLEENAVPTVFDGLLEAPTYLLIRGQETNLDKNRKLAPGVPQILSGDRFQPAQIQLPIEGAQPASRPGVIETYLEHAKREVAVAEANLQQADQQRKKAEELLAHWESKDIPAVPVEPSKGIAEAARIYDFAEKTPLPWKPISGTWTPTDTGWKQSMDGPQGSAIEYHDPIPEAIDVTMEFSTEGGSQWRSVGISFDAVDRMVGGESKRTEEISIYISAYAGGPKIQASFMKDGQWNYPVEAAVSLPVELNRRYRLRILRRGQRFNAFVDDQLKISWDCPLPKAAPRLMATTFDAIATVHRISLKTLDDQTLLVDPKQGTAPSENPESLEEAKRLMADKKLFHESAGLLVGSRRAELEAVKRRAEAWKQAWRNSPPGTTTEPEGEAAELAREAQHVANIRSIEQRVADIKWKMGRSTAAEKPKLENELSGLQEQLQKTMALTDEQKRAVAIAPFEGARWFPTRFASSTADDPAVSFQKTSTGRRTALAQWLTDRSHPLTARVAVNHLWTRHFGRPLVDPPFDFGRKGSPPPQVQLLDWMAAWLIEQDWDLKSLHRLMVTSDLYRRRSESDTVPASHRIDPENQSWWRRAPIRLESQVVRDAVLATAQSLDYSFGGPPIPIDQQNPSRRRSLYFFHSNNDRNSFLSQFDEALVKECYRREQSVIPQQALALFNSQLVLDHSTIAAKQLLTEAGVTKGSVDTPEKEQQIILVAFRRFLGRLPTEDEATACREAMRDFSQSGADGSAANQWEHLCWVLYNHHEFVTLR
jgi:hypothetical protein